MGHKCQLKSKTTEQKGVQKTSQTEAKSGEKSKIMANKTKTEAQTTQDGLKKRSKTMATPKKLKDIKQSDVQPQSGKLSAIAVRADKNKNNSHGLKVELTDWNTEQKSKKSGKEKNVDVEPKKTDDCQALKPCIEDMMLKRFTSGACELPEEAACTIGDVEKMRPYFQLDPVSGHSKVRPSARRKSDGCTALQIAIKAKASAAVKFLLENEADVSLVDYMGDNAVMVAIKESDASVINKLWPYRKGLDINHANILGYTALHLATERKWEGCVNFLLQNGADPNCASTSGCTPLMSAAAKGDLKLVERLIKAGADILMVDQDDYTCVIKAYLEKQQEIVDFLLDSIPDGKKENFLEIVLDVSTRCCTSEEEMKWLETKTFPQLLECSKHTSFRNSFYNKNIIDKVTLYMQAHTPCLETTMCATRLVFCMFFRFDVVDPVDRRFVSQFMDCDGPDYLIRMTKHYTEVWRIPEKQVIFVFLPVIGLSEIAKGRAWLEKNYIAVAEYLNFFDRESLKVYLAPNANYHWCLESDKFPNINKVWKHFFDVIKVYETEQKEKNIMELLRAEEREKMKKLKKKEKKKSKQEDEMTVVCEKSDFETVFGEPLYEDNHPFQKNTSAANDLRMIAQMFSGGETTQKDNVSPMSEVSTDQDSTGDPDSDIGWLPGEAQQTNINGNSNSTAIPNVANVLNSSTVSDSDCPNGDWTTVHTKKQANKEKDKVRAIKPEPIPLTHPPKRAVTPQSSARKRLNQRPRQTPALPTPKSITPPVASNIGSARWADVAKAFTKTEAKEHTQSSGKSSPVRANNELIVEQDFPLLHVMESNRTTLQKCRPNKMTFHFHNNGHLYKDEREDAARETFIGDMIEYELECIENAKASKHISETRAATSHTAYDKKLLAETRCDDNSADTTGVVTKTPAPSDNQELLILRNQRESWDVFEMVCEKRMSDPFISLHTSPAPQDEIQNYKSVIDAMFETQAEIPQSFEEDNGEMKNESGQPEKIRNELCKAGQDVSKTGTETERPSNDFADTDPAIIGYLNNQRECLSDGLKCNEPALLDKSVNVYKSQSANGADDKAVPHSSDGAFFRPISPKRDSSYLPIKSAFGKQLLDNACKTSPGQEKNSPAGSLNIVPFEERNNDKARENFPSFHNSSTASSDLNKNDISVFQKMHQLRVEQLKQFYIHYQREITQNYTIQRDKFVYYAQAAGLTSKQIEQYLNGKVQKELTKVPITHLSQPTDTCPLPYPKPQQAFGNPSIGQRYPSQPCQEPQMPTRHNHEPHNMQLPVKPFPHVGQPPQNQTLVKPMVAFQKQAAMKPMPNQMFHQQVPQPNSNMHPPWFFTLNLPQAAVGLQPTVNQVQAHPTSNTSQSVMQREYERMAAQAPTVQPTPSVCLNGPTSEAFSAITTVPHQPLLNLAPSVHPSQIEMIKASHAAMTYSVRDKIKEVHAAMIEAKARSVRWREKLAGIRALPQERLLTLGKIVIPRQESDRVYLAYHSTGATILGYLADGMEVAIKIMDSSVRNMTPGELDRLKGMDVTNCFLVKYKEFAFYENTYYLASELHEYTLPEYLQQLRPDERIRKARMVFQFLRGLSRLHQQYLMVHGEIRPDNIVIDLEGNVKVAGYGVNRNTDRSAPFVEYSLEDQCWLAPEQLLQKQKVSFKSDIFIAGSVIYYILRHGRSPFGNSVREIVHNISTVNCSLDPDLQEEARDLLAAMLSINRTERPCISDALSHPLFWADEKRLRLISIVGSDIVWDLKQSWSDSGKRESMIDVISSTPCNPKLLKWMETIDNHLLRDMSTYRQYKNTLVELVLFIHNYCNHTDKLSERSRSTVDEACTYFLSKFPSLFMTVYKAIKKSGKKEKTCYKPFF